MTVQPHSVAELQDAVRGHGGLTIRGRGTKSAAGAGTEVGPGTEVGAGTEVRAGTEGGAGTEVRRGRVVLDTTALTGITEYSADECVFTALAGTPLREINTLLAAHGQYLPFDPPLVEAGATIGGTVAAGLSGSERYRYGGVRDFVIGARVVDGEGRLIRSGGKVVKNAAGFLLHHAMVGSLGRFGVLAEITFKVFPSPESRATLRVHCDSLASAVETLRAVEGARFDLAAIDFDDSGLLWIRIAGRADALAARVERLQGTVPWTSEVLNASEDERFWADAREFRWAPADSPLVKIPLPVPSVVGLGSPRSGQALRLRSGQVSRAIRYTCGGKCAWVAIQDLNALSDALVSAGLRGQIVRGEKAGTIIGVVERNAFEERVRSVLDPSRRFSRD